MIDRSGWIILGLAVLAAGLGGWLQHRSAALRRPPGVPSLAVGDPLPALILNDPDGAPHRLADHRGHRVLINLWATWCAPCREEMPRLAKAQAAHPDARVIGIAMDDPARVRRFLVDQPVGYTVLIGDVNSPSTSQRLGDDNELLPYSVVIDRDGRVLQQRRGVLDQGTLDRWLSAPAR